MIEFIKYTAEEVFYKSIKDDPNAVAKVLSASNGSSIALTITFNYSLPAKYAKYLLKEYINNEISSTERPT